jgi:hypothetical protein
MSHRPLIAPFPVEAPILLTTVAGRSSMHGRKVLKNMVIETILFIAFAVIVGAAIVTGYGWHQDVLYGPYMKRVD